MFNRFENYNSKDMAVTLIQKGIQFIQESKFSDAKELFEQSVTHYPTAEGYTFLAWMISKDGLFEHAIECCKKAIEIDPDYGNPYNDIGSYYVELGEVEESINWFKKAIDAKRYGSKHFPYLNLARVYLKLNNLPEATHYFCKALALKPSSEEAKKLLIEFEKDNYKDGSWYQQFYNDN